MDGEDKMKLGGIFIAIGGGITLLTWVFPVGGYVLVAYGAMAVGAIQLLIGFIQWRSGG